MASSKRIRAGVARRRPIRPARPARQDAAAVSADHLWQIGFPFHARRRLHLFATDADWSAGPGGAVTGPIDALLLLLAGRTAGVRGSPAPVPPG